MSSIRRRWFIGRPGRYLRQLPVSWVGVPEEALEEALEIQPHHGAPVVLTPGGWVCVLAFPQQVRENEKKRKARKRKQ